LIVIKNIKFTGTKSTVDEDFNAIAIGDPSFDGSGNLITVDDCYFSGFAHVGIKGTYKWWVKNCYFYNIGGKTSSAYDPEDHGIYFWRPQSSGQESIFEYNYFKNMTGAGIQGYSSNAAQRPSYFIIRYNIIQGNYTANNNTSAYGIVLGGNNGEVYGNTIFDTHFGLDMFREGFHDNSVYNNLFEKNAYDLVIDTTTKPYDNTVQYNWSGGSNQCNACSDQSGGDCNSGAGDCDYTAYVNIGFVRNTADDPFITDTPADWDDFRLTAGIDAIDAGTDLGAGKDSALGAVDTNWPPTAVDQDDYGVAWEIGAFVYGITPGVPVPALNLGSGQIQTSITSNSGGVQVKIH